MWPKNEDEVDRAKELDRQKYGYEGFYSRFGYISFSYCTDMVKMANQGKSPNYLSSFFNLPLLEVITILSYWAKKVNKDEDMNSIVCFGGTEYAEIQKLKEARSLNDEDLNDIWIDLYLLEKQKGEK